MSTFMFISFLHFYWVLGGKWATDRVFPDEVGPMLVNGKMNTILLIATAFVAICFLYFAYLVAAYSGRVLTPFSGNVIKYQLIALAIIFAMRAIGDFKYCGFFKSKKVSLFSYWDTKLYAPLCLGLSICLITLLLLK